MFGRVNLCSVGRPSRWALAHILVKLRFDVQLDTKKVILETFFTANLNNKNK